MTTRFSIIVPTLNRKAMLLAAIDSVRAQNWSNVETIVVDGGSTDGTIEAVESMPDIELLKGPDRGVYDAFNKGINRAGGDFVGILNSDDVYEPGTFSAVADAFARNPRMAAVCGTSVLVDGERVVSIYDRAGDKRLTPRTALIGNCTPNARFFRHIEMSRNGPFNLDYRFVADRDWLMRWYNAGLQTLAIPQRVYRYSRHPGSLTFDANRIREREIRLELLHLARRWRDDPSAKTETTGVAIALEGRCVAYFAMSSLRQRKIGEAARWLTKEDQRLSAAPAASVVRSVIDWSFQKVTPNS